MQDLVNLGKRKKQSNTENSKWNEFKSARFNKNDYLIACIVNSDEIHHLVDGQEQNYSREEDFHEWVRLELRNQLIQKHIDEAAKLTQVYAVPEILEVAQAILPHLNKLEEHEEALSEEAENVAEVL